MLSPADGGRTKEICRYLGYGSRIPDPCILREIEEAEKLLLPLISKKEIHRAFPLASADDGPVRIGDAPAPGKALSRVLTGCEQAVLMAATIGFAPDRLAKRAAASGKMSRALVIGAVGSALIEEWCDEVQEMIREEAASCGLFIRPRFSPGYGDFSIHFQKDLFRMLEVSKYTGITLTGQGMMLPEKSVTAVIGLTRSDSRCPPAGCESCSRSADCSFCRVVPTSVGATRTRPAPSGACPTEGRV